MKDSKCVLSVIVFAAIVLCCPLQSPASSKYDTDTSLSPYFLVKSDDPKVDQFPLLLTSADVNIAGVIADVTVMQVYKNEGTRPIEAVYVFPGSTRAAVYGMTMTVGDRTIFAKIQEKQQARKNYKLAKKQGKTASLLEQQRPNVFQMNVANILPGDRIKVELKYTELLVPTEGVYEFVYPTVVGPRYSNQSAASAPRSEEWVSNPYIQAGISDESDESPYLFDIKTTLSTGIPLQELTSPSHALQVDYKGPSAAEITLDEEIIIEKIKKMKPEHLNNIKVAVKDLYIGEDFGNLPLFYKKLFHIAIAKTAETEIIDERVKTVKEFGGDRDYVLRYRLAGSQIESGLLLCEGKVENFFLLMVQPPQQVKNDDIPPRDYVFIMDVSGSMRGFPIETSKTLLRNLLAGLRPQDSFNVLLFAGSSSLLSEASLPATQENLSRALSLIDKQGGGGGTEILPTLKRALALPKTEGMSRTIVIATDGYVNVESETFDLIRNNLHNANIFPFGIGKSVNRFLLEGMAKTGLGEPFVITRADEARTQAERFRRYIESPVLTGIQLDFDGFDAYDIEPLSVPDVLAERPGIAFGKWRGDAKGTITLKGFSGAGEYQQSFQIDAVSPKEEHAALRYLWARKRIEILGEYNSLRKTDERVREITQLGLNYNLLTPYTSFVAIDEVIRRKADSLKTVKQPLPLPKGVPTSAVRKAPEPDLALLLLIAAILVTLALRPKKCRGNHPQRLNHE